MATIAVPRVEPLNAKPVAPWWHTIALIGLFLSMTVAGAFFQRAAHSQPEMVQHHPQVVPLYLSLLAMEWALFYFVWKGGLRRTGTKLRDLIGGKWSSAKDVMVDVALALALWNIWKGFELVWTRTFSHGHAASIQHLLPQSVIEILLWIGVSVSAGICEELVFRGYFQKQFEALTHAPWIALILQAMLFGVAHGYQGVEACAKIAIYGALYSLLALWRGSLRPGMIAHAGSDIVGGIFGI